MARAATCLGTPKKQLENYPVAIHNPKVGGSSPPATTNTFNHLGSAERAVFNGRCVSLRRRVRLVTRQRKQAGIAAG